MSIGPCLCGDPYCGSCGDPAAAKYADAVDAFNEKLDNVGLDEFEFSLLDLYLDFIVEKIRPENIQHEAIMYNEGREYGASQARARFERPTERGT